MGAGRRYAPRGDHHSAPNENVLDTTLKALFARRRSHYGPEIRPADDAV